MRSREEALSELQRELRVRERCYERWVKDGKLDQIDSTDRMERLIAAIHYIRTDADLTRGGKVE
jgi:hypothetical protein